MYKEKKTSCIASLTLALALMVAMLPAMSAPAQAAESWDTWDGSIASSFAGGSGTESDPYLIETAAQLAYLAQEVNNDEEFSGKAFKLTQNLDLSAHTWTSIGTNNIYNLKQFLGSFDGGGFEIKFNITQSRESGSGYIGLFGNIGSGSTLKNITISGNISNANYHGDVAGLVGYVYGATIENCHNKAQINNAGNGGTSGLVGIAYYSTIKNCHNEGNITALKYASGVANSIGHCTLENCYNIGNITSTTDEHRQAGGVVGSNTSSVMRYCYNSGTVSCINGTAGGVVGHTGWDDYTTLCLVEYCYNIGNVEGSNAGGVIGTSHTGTVQYCYNEGKISGGYAGGITARNRGGGIIQNCYNTGDVVAQYCAGGIAAHVRGEELGGSSIVKNCYNTGDVTSTNGYDLDLTQYGDSHIFESECLAGGIASNLLAIDDTVILQNTVSLGSTVTSANYANRIFRKTDNGKSTYYISNNQAYDGMTTGTNTSASIPTTNIGASESNGASIAMDGSIPLSTVFAGWDTSVWDIPSGNLSLNGPLPTLKNMTMEVESSEKPSDWAVDSVNSAINAGIVPQNLRGSYTEATTRAEFCALSVELYETVTGSEITERAHFDDTTDVNVQKMAALGVVSGVGNNMFSPNASLTREQAATMIARLASVIGKPISTEAPTFSDNASISSWAYDAVGQMQVSGIMSGVGNNMFSPQTDYTREQSIATMLRLYELVK